MSQQQPRILGDDGEFRIVRDAMGVPGLLVAVNCFSPELHQRLFQDSVFTTNAVDFVEQQAGPPLKQCILHPTLNYGVSSPWPDDWHCLINAVRDSGLFQEATIPDNAYALTYRPGSQFECHHDGRGKWGEYVICCSLGSPCTITFQHGAPKRNPFDPTKPWNYVPPAPSCPRPNKEAVVFLLDAHPSMNAPYPSSDNNVNGNSSTRLSCAKKVLEDMVSQLMSHQSNQNEVGFIVFNTEPVKTERMEESDNHNVHPYMTSLTSPAVTRPSVELLQAIRRGECAMTDYTGADLCRGMNMAEQALRNCTFPNNKYDARRLVVFTDAAHRVESSNQDILRVIDKLRELQCTLTVIGMDFENSAKFDEPLAETEAADDNSDATDDESDGEDSDGDDGDKEEDMQNIKCQNEQLLTSIARLTGGSIIAASTMKDIADAGAALGKPAPTDAYWTRSMTDEPVDMYKRKLWQVTMTLPPNSMYVMSGASRYDWRHGINVNQHNHPLPSPRTNSNPLLFPSWNPDNLRRAVIFRSTKVFSNVSLQLEYERAVLSGDTEAAERLEQRVQASTRYPPDAHNSPIMRRASPEEIAAMRAQAHDVLQTLHEGNGVHRLRFAVRDVNFDSSRHVRAVADQEADTTTVVHQGAPPTRWNEGGSGIRLGGAGIGGGGNRLGGGGGGNRLGGERAMAPDGRSISDHEVVVIDDSSDDEEDEGAVPEAQAPSRRRPAEAAGLNHGGETLSTEEERARLRAARLARLG